jgi:hypothetical protein
MPLLNIFFILNNSVGAASASRYGSGFTEIMRLLVAFASTLVETTVYWDVKWDYLGKVSELSWYGK